MISLSIFIILCIRSLQHSCYSWQICTLKHHLSYPPLAVIAILLCFYRFDFFRLHILLISYNTCLFSLGRISLSIMCSRPIQMDQKVYTCSKWQVCTHTNHTHHIRSSSSFIWQWAFRSISYLGC